MLGLYLYIFLLAVLLVDTISHGKKRSLLLVGVMCMFMSSTVFLILIDR